MTITERMEQLKAGAYDSRLLEIYVDEAKLAYQRERYQKAAASYQELFGPGEASVFSAAGRSEVGGNHTDHQQGMVLAASVNLDAIGVAAPIEEAVIRLKSEGYPMLTVDLHDLAKKDAEEGTSMALIRGMAQGLSEKGYRIGGFQAYVTSDVLGGAGLSSSAAFEVLVGTILSGLYNEDQISMVEIAKTAQYAENVYFGKPCGLMDQMACAVGGLIHIDFADGKNPVIRQVDVDFASYHHSLCITDTKGSHADLTDEYAAVPQEMTAVANALGHAVLREVSEQEFYARIPELRRELGDRPVLRAIHFFAEERRVAGQVDALRRGEFEEFLSLIQSSGDSSFQFLQNVYASRDVQNQAVSVGLAVSRQLLGAECGGKGAHGVCRVHGGGFAGTIQAFVADDFVEEYRRGLDAVYGEGSCHVLKVRPVGGTRVF
ncbi:MAG: galactokinase [Lachnospiraceae bacterium]|nr:galactokinase [Lachnospiraceae bacterium]